MAFAPCLFCALDIDGEEKRVLLRGGGSYGFFLKIFVFLKSPLIVPNIGIDLLLQYLTTHSSTRFSGGGGGRAKTRMEANSTELGQRRNQKHVSQPHGSGDTWRHCLEVSDLGHF